MIYSNVKTIGELSPHVQSSEAIKKGNKIVRVPDAHYDMKGSYIMVDKDVADKSIDRNPQSVIKNLKKGRQKPKRVKS